jgi:hypothetical protein
MILASEFETLAPRLHADWNSSFGSHTFVYAHSNSSMEYVIKVDRLGGKAEVRGIGIGDEKITRLEVVAKDYISSAALPLRITLTQAGEEDRSDLQSKLKELFISPSRIQGMYKSIYQKLCVTNNQTRPCISLQNQHNHKTHPRTK